MEKIACEHERSGRDDSSQNPVAMRTFRIERVHTFVLQRRHHVTLDRPNGYVKPIPQIGDMSLARALRKQVLHHGALKRREIAPSVRTLELNKNVVLFLEDNELRDLLFTNLDISARGKIHEGRGDVAWIGAVVDECPHLGRTHALGRLVHWSH